MNASAALVDTQPDDHVVLEVPASMGHLRMVRLLVSALATSHGADLDDLEDLRIAAGELCAHLIDSAGEGDRLVAVADVFHDDEETARSVLVRASIPGRRGLGDFDHISSMVLAAAADDFGLGPGPDPGSGSPEPGLEPIPDGSTAGDPAGIPSTAWFRRRMRSRLAAAGTGD